MNISATRQKGGFDEKVLFLAKVSPPSIWPAPSFPTCHGIQTAQHARLKVQTQVFKKKSSKSEIGPDMKSRRIL